MKKLYINLLSCVAFILGSTTVSAQCTPNTSVCPNGQAVASFGGLCDTTVMNGRVNTPYLDNIQFYIIGSCFDPNEVGVPPPIAGVTARITQLSNFIFSGMPTGINGGTNQASYTIPRNATVYGCAYLAGTPTQAGVFDVVVNITAAYTTANCYWLTQTGSTAVDYNIEYVVLPDPTFTLASTYCSSVTSVNLVPNGTQGGTFSGPGVSGTTFNPSAAGSGTHQIKYVVTAQEGSAVAPTTDSSSVQVTVEAATTWYADADGDGFGNPSVSQQACSQPTGYVANNQDCDDTNAAINPNTVWYADLDGDGYHNPSNTLTQCNRPANYILLSESSGEDCDDTDDNVTGPTRWYADADGDGFGNPNVSVWACTQPSGYVDNNLDCDDTDDTIGSGANEVWYADADGDLYINPNDSTFACSAPAGYISLDDALGIDCDDNDNTIGEATDVFYQDADGDGFGNPSVSVVACEQPTGYVDNDLDCDDTDAGINPNTVWYADLDGDGYHDSNNTLTQCDRPTNFILLSESSGIDCDDSDDEFNEPLTWYADLDGDGYHNPTDSVDQCDRPTGYILLSESDGVDCDDDDANLNAPLVWYADIDGDGYHNPDFSQTNCTRPNNFILLSESLGVDCDDNNPDVNPGAEEIPGNDIDDNCDGTDGPLSIRNISQNNISAYPNPGKEMVTIKFDNNFNTNVNVNILTIDGKVVLSNNYLSVGSSIQINTNQLSSGIYIISVQDDSGLSVIKWIKH